MQTDKDLFEIIKETYPLNPRADFVSATEVKLRQTARKLNRKRIFKRLSFASSGFILCILAISWFLFFNGKNVISNTISSLGANNSASLVNEQKPLIFIYHTHSWESFLPEINGTDPSKAIDNSKNITLVGERLSKDLKEKNVNNIHDNRDMNKILNERGLTLNDSYKVSREFLKDALKKNKSIKMTFDIHRDAERKNVTTIKIDGKDYARINLIISPLSPKYKENKEFALLLSKEIDKKYPGLSRGVFERSSEGNNYNLDLRGESALLEIGGVDNTLEEEYRTVDAFAGVIEGILRMENN
jgi:stage II sporulation protein P